MLAELTHIWHVATAVLSAAFIVLILAGIVIASTLVDDEDDLP